MINETTINITSNYKSVENAITKINTKQLILKNTEGLFEDETKHLDRIFKTFCDENTRSFLNYVSPSHIKKMISEDLIFSNTNNLKSTMVRNDSLFKFEKMSQYEIDDHFKNLSINYNYYDSIFGELIIASTNKGVCYIGFDENKDNALLKLKKYFKNSSLKNIKDDIQQHALLILNGQEKGGTEITLHLNGTEFQIKVWTQLLKIPKGCLSTYNAIAHLIDKPNASRAVGTAIGSNPIAMLIPCHRVVQTSGKMGGYAWGINRKTAIIGWEICKTKNN